MLRLMERIVDNPYVNLFMGFFLFISGLLETLQTLGDDLEHLRLRGIHAILVYGIFNMLKSLPNIIKGVQPASDR